MHVDHVREALTHAIREHGLPNAFHSRWLNEIEGSPLDADQINAFGRRYPTVTVLVDGEAARCQYARGVWFCTVDPSYGPKACTCDAFDVFCASCHGREEAEALGDAPDSVVAARVDAVRRCKARDEFALWAAGFRASFTPGPATAAALARR